MEKKLLAALAALGTLIGSPTPVAQVKPPFFCQGEYSAVSTGPDGDTKTVKLDQWKIAPLPNGLYSLDVELLRATPPASVRAVNQTEHHLLGKNLTPRAFASVISATQNSVIHSFKIQCDYGATEISCNSQDNGLSANGKLKQEAPYVFWPTGLPQTFDIPWGFQAFASQSKRVIGQKTSVPLITLGEEGIGPELGLKLQEIDQIEYLGKESISVLGEKLFAHKFHFIAPDGKIAELWISDSGILLSMRRGEGMIVLTSYHGPSLVQ